MVRIACCVNFGSRTEAVEEFQDATEPMDKFFEDCVSGKLDPRDFLIEDIGQDK